MKKLLLSALLLGSALFSAKAQYVLTGTGFRDGFDGATLNQNAEYGWYADTSVYSLGVANGQLEITAKNADQLFKGFGVYLKNTDTTSGATTGTPVKLNLNNAQKKVLKFDITNPWNKQIKIRVDLKVVDPNFAGPNCPAASGDTIQVNYPETVGVYQFLVPAGQTKTIRIDYATGTPQYQYNTTCTGAWTPTQYPAAAAGGKITNYSDVTGLYMVINPGAGETWCSTTTGECTKYTGKVYIDNLQIGDAILGTNVKSFISESSLYPNPATSEAALKLELKNAADVKVVVTDLMGKVVEEIVAEKTTSLNEVINVSKLGKGMYSVNYYINGEAAKAEKLIVQ